MAGWPVYSHRFLVQAVPAVWKVWTPPAGTRVVVRSVVVVNGQDVAGKGAQVRVGTGWMLIQNPAPRTTVALAYQQVVYGGEQLQGWVDVAGITVMVSGYIFNDPEHAVGPPGTTHFREALPDVEPLPELDA